MENEIEPLAESDILTPESPLKIYSKQAIWGFSVIFTSVFGGVLLFQNLKDIGRKKEANLVLIFSIVFTVASIYIVNIPARPHTALTYLCNMAGGFFLSEYFFKKYFPMRGKYENKKIWKPLIISILITIPFILAMLYTE